MSKKQKAHDMTDEEGNPIGMYDTAEAAHDSRRDSKNGELRKGREGYHKSRLERLARKGGHDPESGYSR
ncbi:MAG: hypothetical protein AB7L92_01665 [Alphaproteobacteria bacterium]